MTQKVKLWRLRGQKFHLPTGEAVIILSLFAMLGGAGIVSEGARRGLVLCAGTVIPAVFPFMVLGDFVSYYISTRGLGLFEYVFCKPLGLSQPLGAIGISGLLCGFPSAARSARDAYGRGEISASDAIYASALFSNPSPSFIVGAVGAGLFGEAAIGATLLLTLVISVFVTATIFAKRRQENQFPDIIPRQKYDFVASVQSAGSASITVFSFVVFFCTLIELLSRLIGRGILFSVAVPLLEVSTALVHLSTNSEIQPIFRNLLIGFSLGFGGLSANLQCAAFLRGASLPLKKFFLIKFTLGIICAALTAIALQLF